MEAAEEARRLHAVFADHPSDLLAHLARQIARVKTYAQVLVGLCGLTLSVTGVAGARMIRAGSLAAMLMVCGIVLVLIGLVLCIRTITTMRWVTQDLRDDLVETARVVIERRDRQQRRLTTAARFVGGGIVLYLAAVVVTATVPSSNFIG
jgi:hypothetical protein